MSDSDRRGRQTWVTKQDLLFSQEQDYMYATTCCTIAYATSCCTIADAAAASTVRLTARLPGARTDT